MDVATPANASTTCRDGVVTAPAGGGTIAFSDGELGTGETCTVTVDVTAGTAGVHTNPSISLAFAELGGDPPTTAPADLTVSATLPGFSKSFAPSSVPLGGRSTLTFTIDNSLNGSFVLFLAFTDNLPAGDTLLTFAGATLMPGDVCTFSVTLDVPAAATAGPHTNTTSGVVATVLGVTGTENPASDDLEITGLSLTKSFTDDPVIPGGTVTLEFTIDNQSPDDATGIFFTDNLGLSGFMLSPALPDLASTSGTLTDVCGSGSQITGTTVLTFTGGDLLAGDPPCTFSVTLDVPLGTASDTYINATTGSFTFLGGTLVFPDPATDDLIVSSDLLSLTKSFTDDPVAPGGTVTLEFMIANLDSGTITDIAFTDDLEAALAGLAPAAGGLPMDGFCGPGSTLTFMTGELTLAGGMLTSSAMCTFSVTLDVPMGATGPTATNTTSSVSGLVGALPVVGAAASDDLFIQTITFSKVFSVPVPPGGTAQAGGTVMLTFTIQNLDASAGVSDLEFADDLTATLAGLTATSLPTDPCGATGSSIAGTSTLTFTGGNLLPGGDCTFAVDLLLPLTPLAGTFPNATSDLFVAGLPVASAAADDLVIATDVPNTVSADASNAAPVMVTITTTVTAP